jgi:(2Fe-2S) ferredoxin
LINVTKCIRACKPKPALKVRTNFNKITKAKAT